MTEADADAIIGRILVCVAKCRMFGLHRSPRWWMTKMSTDQWGPINPDLDPVADGKGGHEMALKKPSRASVLHWLERWEQKLADHTWVAKLQDMLPNDKQEPDW